MNQIPNKKFQARLLVARKAADLFWERGFAETSGDDIAAAAGISTRTVWRYFRAKENCIEPLFEVSSYNRANTWERWRPDTSLEDFIQREIQAYEPNPDQITNDLYAISMIAMGSREPALKSTWLMACNKIETMFTPIMAERLGSSPQSLEARICAAAITSAIRLINEDLSIRAFYHSQHFTTNQIGEQLAKAIRQACPAEICDAAPARPSPNRSHRD